MIEINREHQNRVVRLILNKPKGNILSEAMMKAIMASVKEESKNPDLSLFVLEGRGKHFSFGASIEEHQKEKITGVIQSFTDLFRNLSECSIPIASLIRGQCLGGGFELALFSHFMFAGEQALFGIPEITLGVFPPPASILLPLKLGQTAADRMVLTGSIFKANDLKQWGLLDAVWPEENLEEEFQKWLAKRILPLSARSLRFAVQAARFHFDQLFLSNLEKLNDLYCQNLMETRDANEGIQAFLEKRKPIWENK